MYCEIIKAYNKQSLFCLHFQIHLLIWNESDGFVDGITGRIVGGVIDEVIGGVIGGDPGRHGNVTSSFCFNLRI